MGTFSLLQTPMESLRAFRESSENPHDKLRELRESSNDSYNKPKRAQREFDKTPQERLEEDPCNKPKGTQRKLSGTHEKPKKAQRRTHTVNPRELRGFIRVRLRESLEDP